MRLQTISVFHTCRPAGLPHRNGHIVLTWYVHWNQRSGIANWLSAVVCVVSGNINLPFVIDISSFLFMYAYYYYYSYIDYIVNFKTKFEECSRRVFIILIHLKSASGEQLITWTIDQYLQYKSMYHIFKQLFVWYTNIEMRNEKCL